MPATLSTAFSHVILGTIGFCCWQRVGTRHFYYPQGCFAIITVNSMVGFIRHAFRELGEQFKDLYHCTCILETIFACPCIATTVYLAYGFRREIAIAHTAISIIPIISYFNSGHREAREWAEFVLVWNVISLGIVSYVNSNIWGLFTAIIMSVSQFNFREHRGRDVPPQELYNYGMCLFAYCALRTLNEIFMVEIVLA